MKGRQWTPAKIMTFWRVYVTAGINHCESHIDFNLYLPSNYKEFQMRGAGISLNKKCIHIVTLRFTQTSPLPPSISARCIWFPLQPYTVCWVPPCLICCEKVKEDKTTISFQDAACFLGCFRVLQRNLLLLKTDLLISINSFCRAVRVLAGTQSVSSPQSAIQGLDKHLPTNTEEQHCAPVELCIFHALADYLAFHISTRTQ